MSGVQTEFKERIGIGEQRDPFPHREPGFGMLVFDGLWPAALTNNFTFVAHLRHEVGKKPHIGFKASRCRVNFRSEHVAVYRRVGGESSVAVGHRSYKRTDYGIPARRKGAIRQTRQTPAVIADDGSVRWPPQSGPRQWRRSI